MPTKRNPTRAPRASARPYPDSWERVAELKVFRTPAGRWPHLLGWRSEMRTKGWRLLHVTSERGQICAVFGRTRAQLLEDHQSDE